MVHYEYVNVIGEGFWASKFTAHRDIIDKYAKRGYRYVGFVPARSDNGGRITEIDLIFEKQE